MFKLFFPFFLIGLGAYLRFHNIDNLYIFGFDEEYQATYAMTQVLDFHPIWIGVSASFLDYYLGPYFTYFTAFWLMLSGGDPLITAYVAGAVGVITSVVVFFVGWKFFNLTTGIISSLFYAGLPLFVFYDQKYWNPMFVQLIVLALFASLLLIKKSPWWWLLFTAAVGVIFETDLAPLPLVIIGIYFFIKGKYFLNKKLVLSCFVVFLFFYWPLLVFDYYHNWSNLTVLGRYSQQAKQAGAKFNPISKLTSVTDTMSRFWYLEPGNSNADELNISCGKKTYPYFWLSGLSVILLLYFLNMAFGKKEYPYRLLAFFLIVSLGFYIFYTGGSFEYYLHGFITLFVFVPAIIISRFNKKLKIVFFVLITLTLLAGFNTVLNSSDNFSLGPKRELIEKIIEKVGDNSFSLEKMGECHIYEGWRYLFKVYGKTPVKAYTDQNFGWLYPEEVNNKQAVYNVILSEYGTIEAGGFGADIRRVSQRKIE